MRTALLLAAAAPAIAGVIALLWPDPERALGPELAPRAIGAGGVLAAAGAAVWLAWATGRERFLPIGGLEADPWRALLVLAIAAGAAAWLVRRRESNDVLVARLGLTSALIGTVLASDGGVAAAMLAAGSACALWLGVRGHLASRTARALIATDLVMLVCVWLRTPGGLSAPMSMDGVVGWIWIACLLVRAGIWSRADEEGLALGYRMQVVWFATWVAGADARSALALVAVAVAAVGARRAARDASSPALGMTLSMLAVTAIAPADADLAGAAAVLTGAAATSGVLSALGRGRAVLAGLVPAGAALPGVAILASVALQDRDGAGALTAVGVCLAACWLAVATGSSMREPAIRARAGWGLLALAASAAIASVPRSFAEAFATGGALTEVAEQIPTWFVPLAFAAIVIASVGARDRDDGAPGGPEVVEPAWSARRAHVVAAAAVVLAAALIVIRATARGFL